jgi:hypothetical protein
LIIFDIYFLFIIGSLLLLLCYIFLTKLSGYLYIFWQFFGTSLITSILCFLFRFSIRLFYFTHIFLFKLQPFLGKLIKIIIFILDYLFLFIFTFLVITKLLIILFIINNNLTSNFLCVTFALFISIHWIWQTVCSSSHNFFEWFAIIRIFSKL